MPRKLISSRTRGTHPLVWLAAIICTVITVAVIITGTVVFVGYLAIHPRVPSISVVEAHLDNIQNDLSGRLEIQVTTVLRAKNDNLKAHARFSNWGFKLSFLGLEIARMAAASFDVGKNSSQDLRYEVGSSSIPLNPVQMERVSLWMKRDVIWFDLKGSSRTRWRIGLLGSVKFWCRLDCQLKFHQSNGSYIKSPCTSQSK